MKYIKLFFFGILFLATITSLGQSKDYSLSLGLGYYAPSRGAIYDISFDKRIGSFEKTEMSIGLNYSYGGQYGISGGGSSSYHQVGEKLNPYAINHLLVQVSSDFNANKKGFGCVINLGTGIGKYVIPTVISNSTFFLGETISFQNNNRFVCCLSPKINPYYKLSLMNSQIDVGVYYKAYITPVFGQSVGCQVRIGLF